MERYGKWQVWIASVTGKIRVSYSMQNGSWQKTRNTETLNGVSAME